MKLFSPKITEGLTYDDVLLKPCRSAIASRKDVDLAVQLMPGIVLNLPIISAPMDTVTESAMAIALARAGALGVIHRFNTIEKQAEEVAKVKRTENYFLENPLSVEATLPLRKLLDKIKTVNHSSFLVVDKENRLLGLVSKRDYLLETDLTKLVKELMTPFEKLVCVNEFITLEAAREFFQKHRIEKLPVIDNNRKVKGLITAKDVLQSSNSKAIRDSRGRLVTAAAVGVKQDFLERAHALVAAGCDVLVLDIAHGHLEICLQTTAELKKAFPTTPLIVGNIATREGAKDLAKAGADVIKVGVGPGTACTTRIVTGFGVPQLTAILDAEKGAGRVPIVADGGIRNSGDMVKALGAGASAVMMGGMFAGTDEAPGKLTMWNGRKVKLYRGMASLAAYSDKSSSEVGDFTAEGVDQAFVPAKGAVSDLLKVWEGGLRSGFSYAGAKNLEQLWQNAEFIKITQAGMTESKPHDIASV